MYKIFNKDVCRENVPAIALFSHGTLSAAMIKTAAQIVGEKETESLIALGLEETDDAELYGDEMVSIIDQLPKGSLLLFDLFGGTPFNQYCQKGLGHGMLALTGVNLGMLLDLLDCRTNMQGEDLLKAAEEMGRNGIVNITALESQDRTKSNESQSDE